MKNILAVIVVAATVLLATHAQAQTCTNPNPRSSPVWEAFEFYVQAEYGLGNPLTGTQGAYAYGHALGRLATAVRGDAERREAFACVELALDQIFTATQLVDQTSSGLFKTMQYASMGMFDDEVARRFGIVAAPAYDEVFDLAMQLAGRQPAPVSGGTAAPAPPPKPGTTAGGVIPSFNGATVSGTNSFCESGADGRWSLAEAISLISDAYDLQSTVGEAGCVGDDWYICRDISDALHEARDHIFQVVDQNHDGIAQCRLCNYGNALGIAEILTEEEDWLYANSYNASGLGNIFYTIGDMSRDPLCQVPAQTAVSVPPTPAPNPTPTPAPVSGAGGNSSGGNAGTGITVNTSRMAMAGAAACLGANLESGKNWIFRNPNVPGGSDYYEHGGYVCSDDRNYFMSIGDPMLAFICDAEWANCERQPEDDGRLKPPFEDVEFWGKNYTRQQFEWINVEFVDYIVLVEK